MGKSKAQSTGKEKLAGFFYVFLVFLVASVVCSFILFFSGSDYRFAQSKQTALVQMERVSSFRKAQNSYIEKIEKINENVNQMNPGLNASQEKRDLNYEIGELQKIYTINKHDDRYRIFALLARYFELKLFDREQLYSSQKNIERFEAALERCRNGLETLSNK